MPLLDVRQRFIEFTGRYDLVVDAVDFVDNGANWYIQQGQRWLDRRSTLYQSVARNYQTVQVGEWYKLIPQCRSIEEVWLSNDPSNPLPLITYPYGYLGDDDFWLDTYGYLTPNGGNKWKLQRMTEPQIRWMFRSDPALLIPGTPFAYAPIDLRVVPQAQPGADTGIDAWGTTVYNVTATPPYGNIGVQFLPPSASLLLLEVKGLFYQPFLSDDIDTNVWTEDHAVVLVMAAARAVELSMRNQQGVADYTAQIDEELRGLEHDLVDMDISELKGIRS